MSKAKNCPRCERFFNPKFSGKDWQGTIICTDCWVSQQLKDTALNTKLHDTTTAANNGNGSLK